ncbi:hypothetical protein FB45DRAFT_873621 [Roridomyces roridus]|uniref:Uncharacterized protein n=1 Tax=Roridomyces roridus TaxID=1738132 RepID=A0AAD7BAI4_9AGAR|nr:hypothetical protein FB45DRAFT_873621 [Roridomyces roridus]
MFTQEIFLLERKRFEGELQEIFQVGGLRETSTLLSSNLSLAATARPPDRVLSQSESLSSLSTLKVTNQILSEIPIRTGPTTGLRLFGISDGAKFLLDHRGMLSRGETRVSTIYQAPISPGSTGPQSHEISPSLMSGPDGGFRHRPSAAIPQPMASESELEPIFAISPPKTPNAALPEPRIIEAYAIATGKIAHPDSSRRWTVPATVAFQPRMTMSDVFRPDGIGTNNTGGRTHVSAHALKYKDCHIHHTLPVLIRHVLPSKKSRKASGVVNHVLRSAPMIKLVFSRLPTQSRWEQDGIRCNAKNTTRHWVGTKR